jgi:hypothetical protein
MVSVACRNAGYEKVGRGTPSHVAIHAKAKITIALACSLPPNLPPFNDTIPIPKCEFRKFPAKPAQYRAVFGPESRPRKHDALWPHPAKVAL